jgi:thiamine-monophosphate kinase
MFENRSKPKRTELSELGEFGLIDYLTKDIQIHNTSTLKGIGDDAAVLDYGGKMLLISTDILTEGVHFDLSYTPLKHLGYKAAVVNFSDIYAMNGHPKQLLAAISVSNRFPVEALEEFYEGLKMACTKYGVDLVGGDTTSSASGLFMAITVTGEADKDRIAYRSGAGENDLICVSGDLGAAYTGLLLLEREKQVFKANPEMQPDLEGFDYPLERQLKPEARRDIVKLLNDAGVVPTSMIDISDGLASEILHICRQSGKGCALYEEKIPIDAVTVNLAESFNIAPLIAALNGGEDYELLFTIQLSDFEKIRNLDGITMIGHITPAEAGCNLITESGQQITIQAQGWNHMAKNQ